MEREINQENDNSELTFSLTKTEMENEINEGNESEVILNNTTMKSGVNERNDNDEVKVNLAEIEMQNETSEGNKDNEFKLASSMTKTENGVNEENELKITLNKIKLESGLSEENELNEDQDSNEQDSLDLRDVKNDVCYDANEDVCYDANEDVTERENAKILDNVSSVDESDENVVKIVVFGKDGTGKTALIVRLLTKRFIHEYDPTSEELYAHHCVIDGDEVVLKIMDTAGMVERNIHEREEQIRWGDGFLLVLSLTCEDSLKVLHLIRALIEEVNACEKPMALVANKSDLLQARKIPPSSVADLTEKWNCSAFETTATEDYGIVEEPFIFLCKEIMKRKKTGLKVSSKTKIDNDLILADVNKRFEPKHQESFCDTAPQLDNSSQIL